MGVGQTLLWWPKGGRSAFPWQVSDAWGLDCKTEVFYLPGQFRQFTAVFRSSVVAARPQMPCRLAHRRWERISPHALGSRYEGQIRMKALASARVERTRR
jgi:hypothetical protein